LAVSLSQEDTVTDLWLGILDRPFGDVLEELCTQVPAGRARPYSNVELARLIVAQDGQITPAYIAQLRRGHRDNPTLRLISHLGSALDAHPAYFLGGRRDRDQGTHTPQPLARKVDFLFRHVLHSKGRNEYSHEAVAAAIREHGSELHDPLWTISPDKISELRSGHGTSPTLRHLLGLARFFGAPPAYFVDDQLAARVEEQYRQLRLLSQFDIQAVATRAAAEPLSPQTRAKLVRALVEALEPLGITAETAREALTPQQQEPP
jgi:transcriptional regulator with XRE-family HTH domain